MQERKITVITAGSICSSSINDFKSHKCIGRNAIYNKSDFLGKKTNEKLPLSFQDDGEIECNGCKRISMQSYEQYIFDLYIEVMWNDEERWDFDFYNLINKK